MAIAPAPPTQTIDISPVGRVEGDLDVRVDIANGVVVDAAASRGSRWREIQARTPAMSAWLFLSSA